MGSNHIAAIYCDCGHSSIFHLIWKDQNNNSYSKCFGADRHWYFTTFGNVDFKDEASFAQVIEKDVTCKCTRGFEVKE